MVPSFCLISWATPVFFSPAWVEAAQATVSPLPRVQSAPPTFARYLVKLLVVPEASERCTTVIALSGRVTPGLSAATAGSFHLVTFAPKIFARVGPLSCSLETPERLYDTVIGAAT